MSFDQNLKDYIDHMSMISSTSGSGTCNPNPQFVLGDLDYEKYINGTARKIDNTVSKNTPASLYIKGHGGTLIGSIKFPLVRGMEYRAVCDALGVYDGQASNKKVSYYTGAVSYDAEKGIMTPQTFPIDNTKVGILTKPLKKGDTSITYSIEGGQPFELKDSKYYQQVIGYKKQADNTYRYVAISGRKYNNLGYSRWLCYGGRNGAFDQEPVDNGDGTFTLNLRIAWNTKDLEAGDVVLQSRSGANYSYWIPNHYFQLDNKWHRYASAWELYDGDKNNYTGGYDFIPFRQEAVWGSLLILPNYKIDSGDIAKVESWYSSIRLEYRYKN